MSMRNQNVKICPYCFITVAPFDRNKVQTTKGLAHYNCAIGKAVKRLEKAGLPRPGSLSRFEFRKYLTDQTEKLSTRPLNEVKEQLFVIQEISEEIFQEPIISKLMVKQKTGQVPAFSELVPA